MRDSILFVAAAALAAAWATTHVATIVAVLRSRVSVALRVVAFVPPITPVIAYVGGAWVRATLWILFGVGYVVVRLLS